MVTAGGTSAVYGVGALTGITGTASSGTPGPMRPASANAGQLVTLTGKAFDANTNVVFQTIDSGGNRGDIVVHPTSVSSDGTQAR